LSIFKFIHTAYLLQYAQKYGFILQVYKELPSLGYDDPHTVLNVLSTGFLKGRYLVDAVNCDQQPVEYYEDSELTIGAVINVYGRNVVLTDCDPFTKEYYAKKYGLGMLC
jgi:hypothetical protein